MSELKRKFHNPTQGWVGAVVLDDDNKPKGRPVEPGGSIWLSQKEERLTAEAPHSAEDNPFTKPWQEVTEFHQDGSAKTTIDHVGVLQLSDEGPREIVSDRFIPSRGESDGDDGAEPEGETAVEEPAEEITGAPPLPKQPPVEGKPDPDEIVATPEAVAANDEHLAALAEEEDEELEGTDGVPKLKGTEAIGVRREPAGAALV